MRADPLRFLLLGLLCLSGIFGGSVRPADGERPDQAGGSIITVTSVEDETFVNGNCSLREAVLAANRDAAVDACPAGNGVDTILLPGGNYPLTIAGAGEDEGLTGDLDIQSSMKIRGAGRGITTIRMYELVVDRIVEIHDPALAVEISDLTLERGRIIVENQGDQLTGGGAIYNQGTLQLTNTGFYENRSEGDDSTGGAIYNAGKIEIENSLFSHNHASAGAWDSTENEGIEKGSVIANHGQMTLNNTQFIENDGIVITNAVNAAAVIENSLFDENKRISNEQVPQSIGAIDQFGQMVIRNSNILRNEGFTVGAISNSGNLIIEDSTISDNESIEGSSGITQWEGNLTILRSQISDNSGGFGPGGLLIENAENVLIEQCLFSGNTNYRGAIEHHNGPTTILNTSIISNSAYTGAGIEVLGEGVQIIGSTIMWNNADEGAGIFSLGSFTLENSTVSENEAVNYGGGGVLIHGGKATLLNATITRNIPTGITTSIDSPAIVQVRSSIIAENYGDDQQAKLEDCFNEGPAITSLGWNLIGTIEGCNWAAAQGDLLGTENQPINPRLYPLRNNGGYTFTHALEQGSPALDAGGQNCPATDQRGIPRPQGPACDIGSFELEAPEPVFQNQLYLPFISR